jgi:glycosyltransferase involved in cell wall biosynthesis
MIGIFNDSYPPIMDGVAVAVQNYACWLHRKEQEVCVVTVKMKGCADREDYPVYRYASLPLPLRKPFRVGVPFMDVSFLKAIGKIPFELIHVHCPFSSADVALYLAKQQKIPVVATFHSKYKDDFERHVPNKRLVNWMVKRVIDFYEKADEVWIPQPAVEETLREYGYRGKIVVVNNATDFTVDGNVDELKRHSREELDIPPDIPVFLFIGQHIWEKNVQMILEALSLIKDVPFRMFFIGTGYAERELQKLAVQLGLSSRVKFLGLIRERETLKRYYAAADLFLFPSLYDNAPLVVREAAALHTPSVLLKGSTAAEIIIDNYNGFLSARSSEAFAGRIRELIKSPETIRQAGLRASESIARSWESVVAEEVLDRYMYIIRNHGVSH